MTDLVLLRSLKVAIVGLGLMGGSMALGLRGKCAGLLGIEPDETIRKIALDRNVVDEISEDPKPILLIADAIVLAAPVGVIIDTLKVLPEISPGNSFVIDLGSTKRKILEEMEKLPVRFEVVGGHPMCGKEKSSLLYADSCLFDKAPFVLCELPRTTQRVRQFAMELISAVGANPVWMDADQHDRWVAATSHFPYLLSQALTLSTPEDASPLIGPGFHSTTRLAGSSVHMMLDILTTNQDHVLSQLSRFEDQLNLIKISIENGNIVELSEILSTGRQYHEALTLPKEPFDN